MRLFNVRTPLHLAALATVLAGVAAQSQPATFQGAWLEAGLSCAGVFVAGRDGPAFRKPVSALTPAFIISGRRLSTPLAACRIARSRESGDREIIDLRCTTTVTTEARAILAATGDGGLHRYLAEDGGIGARYQRCRLEDLHKAGTPKPR